ncbi:MAG TPA: hypothetical protein VJ933_06525, partial [Phaeodactylibacter sp.]|nr:hypothetical protein [Phaeodactylibacter sp.]
MVSSARGRSVRDGNGDKAIVLLWLDVPFDDTEDKVEAVGSVVPAEEENVGDSFFGARRPVSERPLFCPKLLLLSLA